MLEYGDYEGKECTVTVNKDGGFFILDPNHILLADCHLVNCIKREIDSWEIKNASYNFTFIYTIINQGSKAADCILHEHKFEQQGSTTQKKTIKTGLISRKHYIYIENYYQCLVCGFMYKLEMERSLIVMDELVQNKKTPYTFHQFGAQLTKVRIYRGYKTQNSVCKEINISRQVFSMWELNKRLPSVEQLVLLADFFQVDIKYFVLQDAKPEEYAIHSIGE